MLSFVSAHLSKLDNIQYVFKDNYVAVIAKYKEDISWLTDLKCKYVVYDKSKDIPNIGREAETYLRYIIEHYDTLPEYVMFLQGHPFDHLNIGTIQYLNKAINTAYPPNCVVPLGIMRHFWTDRPVNASKSFRALFDAEPPPAFFHVTGAQYIVSRSCILNHPKKFYETVRQVLVDTYDLIELPNNSLVCPWALEALWPCIFNVSFPSKDIKYSDLL
jgi:hypothetical protein